MIEGRYSREREIGRGGSGTVWLGRDEVLGRRVALKRIGLLPGADEADVARAEREARLGARLNHPHVVSVFDMVSDPESGEWWLVMEYVEGATLAEIVRSRGRLTPDEAAPLLWQAADALVAAHAAGITHRDVKPSNILVGNDQHVKLTDFGIAKSLSDPSLTQTGMMTGSPGYLAPEVASGGRGDEAADVWSLGATTFHVLAGHAPYEVGDSVLGTLYRIVNEEPPRLSDAGWMAPLLENTMVRDPARRWTMPQVREVLARSPGESTVAVVRPERFEREDDGRTQVIDLSVEPRVVPAPEPEQPVGPRRRGLVLAGAAVAALLLGVALVFALTRGEPSADAGRQPAGVTGGGDTAVAARPTAAGIEAFIRDYVATVSKDPDRAWSMLTPKFQRESGGLARYRDFWSEATDGRVLSIDADPKNLTVSYHVHFDDFDNGPGPTVLDLKFVNGHYLIDGERTKGFEPADD